MYKKYFRLFSLLVVLCLGQAVYALDFQVNQTGDAGDGVCDSTCTLRDAILAANNAASDDTISFSYLVFNAGATITLSGGEMVVVPNGSLTVNGIGAEKVIVDGNLGGRIITNNGAVLTIKNMSFTRGTGVSATSTGRAGAIYNNGGTLTLMNLRLYNNTANNGGALNTAGTGAVTNIYNCDIYDNTTNSSSGGALQNFSGAFLNVRNSTFRNNRMMGSTSATGGAMQLNGTSTITNTTFSGNMTSNDGGAISFNGPSLVMTNTTIVGNSATDQNGGLHKTTSTATSGVIRNNLIAGNSSANSADSGGIWNSQGFNLIQNPGTTTGLTPQDITGQPPFLSPLGNYGGFGYTYVPLSSSPALNAGDNCVVDLTCAASNPPFALVDDQRGAYRPFGSAVDIGSVEHNTAYVAELKEGNLIQNYSVIITPNRGTFTYTLVGSLPPGLSLTSSLAGKGEEDGVSSQVMIQGTPTALGVYNFGILISDGMNSTTVNYRIRIAPTILTGRVFDDAGNPISGVFVSLDNGMGGIQTAQTTIDGTYTFTNVTNGSNYTVSYNSRRYNFRPEAIQIVPGTNTIDPVIQ